MPHYDYPSDYENAVPPLPPEAPMAMPMPGPNALRNTTPLTFTALNDVYREYEYIKDGSAYVVRVHQPRYLNVNPVHGAHRILDEAGVVHYLPGNFLALRWKVAEGTPHFHTTVMQPNGESVQTTFPAA